MSYALIKQNNSFYGLSDDFFQISVSLYEWSSGEFKTIICNDGKELVAKTLMEISESYDWRVDLKESYLSFFSHKYNRDALWITYDLLAGRKSLKEVSFSYEKNRTDSDPSFQVFLKAVIFLLAIVEFDERDVVLDKKQNDLICSIAASTLSQMDYVRFEKKKSVFIPLRLLLYLADFIYSKGGLSKEVIENSDTKNSELPEFETMAENYAVFMEGHDAPGLITMEKETLTTIDTVISELKSDVEVEEVLSEHVPKIVDKGFKQFNSEMTLIHDSLFGKRYYEKFLTSLSADSFLRKLTYKEVVKLSLCLLVLPTRRCLDAEVSLRRLEMIDEISALTGRVTEDYKILTKRRNSRDIDKVFAMSKHIKKYKMSDQTLLKALEKV